MPLPFILAAAAWGGAAYMAQKSQKEVQNKIMECNQIWDEIENISDNTKILAETTYDNYVDSVLQLDKLREDIFYGTLTNFVETLNKIRNAIELSDDLYCLPVVSNDTVITQYSASEHKIHRSDAFASPILAGGIAVAFGAIGGGLMFVQGKMKKAQIEGQIDEANTVLSKVKSEAEQVKYKCDQMDYAASRLDLFYNTFCTLEELVTAGINEMNSIIQTEGTDYRFYSVESREQIMTISNLAKLLRDFVKDDIVDYDGEITYDAESRYEECVGLLQANGYDVDDYDNNDYDEYEDDYDYYNYTRYLKIGDMVKIHRSISRYWLSYDKSTKVKNMPDRYYNYSWEVVEISNDRNKYLLVANGETIVLAKDDIYGL